VVPPVIPAVLLVIPAVLLVIPAEAGIQASFPRRWESRPFRLDSHSPQGPGANSVAASTKDFAAEKDGEETALRTRVKGRAFGSPLARGLYPRASTAEVDPRASPGPRPLSGAKPFPDLVDKIRDEKSVRPLRASFFREPFS